jgi:TrmH family RNA methyltransferase
MLSKQTVKITKSLQNKKFRRLYKQFFIEGEKSVVEVLRSDFVIHKILVTDYFETTYKSELKPYTDRIEKATEKELNDIGTLQTNDSAIVICEMKPESKAELIENEWTIVLDNINDPGNLGTIIRVADWYGIKQIICSEETADFYNPKVINASKGSFLRVSVNYTDLEPFLRQHKVPIYGADLHGENIHQSIFPKQGILVLGNEAHGMRDEIKNLLTHTITIPRFGMAESLNVGIATAICCDRIIGQNQ